MKVETLSVVSQTTRKKYTTPDGQYSLTTDVTRNDKCVTSCSGGSIEREDGVQVATVQNWSRYNGMTIIYNQDSDIVALASVVKQLTDAIAADNEEKGGEA